MEFLGFDVCTRTMQVCWPVAKRLALKAVITEKWLTVPCVVHLQDITSLLGTIWNTAFIAPLGNYLSICLQQCINEAVSQAGQEAGSQHWWCQHTIRVPTEVLEDVATIYHSLDDNESHPVWQSYIGYLVNREPTTRIISDASYKGIGGWSPNNLFKWRLN
jgi:hypothetical protein